MKSAVVIPTYNECENIELLVKSIFDLNVKGMSIIIVDDNSPDGTGEIADKLAKFYKNRILVLHRVIKGRASAGLDGFKVALASGAECIIEMDADFSHDPKYIADFLREIENYDVVIGSRYVLGGENENCPVINTMLSKISNSFNRFMLGLKVRDCSGGYKCYRKKVLETIGLENFTSREYSIGAELLYRCAVNGFSFKEVPIVFRNRTRGKSKLNWKIIFLYPIDILKLRFFWKHGNKV